MSNGDEEKQRKFDPASGHVTKADEQGIYGRGGITRSRIGRRQRRSMSRSKHHAERLNRLVLLRVRYISCRVWRVMQVLYPAANSVDQLDESKLSIKIARHSACGDCTSCPGLRPPLGLGVVRDGDDVERMISSFIDSEDEDSTQYLDICSCGHGITSHGANKDVLGSEEFARRGRAAVRLDELLQV
jgi:hypothetical protein